MGLLGCLSPSKAQFHLPNLFFKTQSNFNLYLKTSCNTSTLINSHQIDPLNLLYSIYRFHSDCSSRFFTLICFKKMTLNSSNNVLITNSRFIRNNTQLMEDEEHQGLIITTNTGPLDSNRQTQEQASILVRLAMRVSRAKWFTFLRRVFHYQNGPSSPLGSNPFNSSNWMVLEFITLVLQICISLVVLNVSKEEKPVWPMRIWVIGYGSGCVMGLLILSWRFGYYHFRQGVDNQTSLPNVEQQCINDYPSKRWKLKMVNKCKASLDLFFAMWFVVGTVWIFDNRFGPVNNGAPKLHLLCISILAWNAITYSFPFILFILLCICVPLISTFIGYNMSLGSAEKGASIDQISSLLCWRFKEDDITLEAGHSSYHNHDPICCICLAKYKEKEEIRQLPCTHIFHKKCVDQWLGIISCCPLCKKGLD